MSNLLSYTSEVKKGIIGMLMFTLYSDEKTIYREYVQNALDSINTAVKNGILSEALDGTVCIDINKKDKIITIKDNGTGIELDKALSTLLDVSASTKDGISQAGQFGIGRLVGGGYCHEMVFKTTAINEKQGTQITFNVDKIWKMVKEDATDYPAAYVIDECTDKILFDTAPDEHYFEVTLKDVKVETAPALLNAEEITNYLNCIAPVDYKTTFKNPIIYKSIKDLPNFKVLYDNIVKVQIFVNGKKIQKQYDSIVVGSKDKIDHLEFFELEDTKYGKLGWGWFAMTKFTIQIKDDQDQLVGIRLRKHNIQIGGDNLLSGSSYWKEERSNAYFYGEIFVTHPNIIPNAARDGLAPTPETFAFNTAIRKKFEELKQLYTKANEAKNSINKINEGINRIKKYGADDYNAKDLINNKGIGVYEKLKKIPSGLIRTMLTLYQPEYDEAINRLNSVNDLVKQPNTLPVESQETEDVSVNSPKETKKEKNNITSHKKDLFDSIPSNETEYKPKTTESASKDVEKDNSTSQKTTYFPKADIVAPLNGVMSDEEVWLIRRIFKIMNTVNPQKESDRKFIEDLKKLIVEELKAENEN